MPSQTTHVVARVAALPQHVEAVRTILLELLAPTRREQGCIRYDLLENLSTPTDFVFVEEWDSEGALDAHLATPMLGAAVQKLQGLLASNPDIRRYRPPE
jgi:quinol monooxygenase YgiN